MQVHRQLARGVLVALEGLDGTGKSTQAARLEGRYRERGYAVTLLREPTMSLWGRRLRESMQTGAQRLPPAQELELFLQDRRYDVAEHITPALAAHKLVLMDRYYFSTIAYQGALGIDPEHIRHLNEAFAPVPDLVCIFLMPPAVALERIRGSRGQTLDTFEREEYLQRVDQLFRAMQGPYIHHIAADLPLDVVTATLQEKIDAVLPAP